MPPTRILKFILAALAIVLVAGAIAFYLLIRSPWVEGAVARELAARLGEPVTLGGLASGYAPMPWFEVTDLAIGAPTADGSPLLTLARAHIELPWSTVWRRQNRLERAEVESLYLRIAIATDGSDNFTALIERLMAGDDEPAADWSVGTASVDGSSVLYTDARDDLRVAVSGIGLEATALAPGQSFPLELRLAVQYGETILHLGIDGDTTLDPDQGRYLLEGARLKGWIGSPGLGLGGVDWTATIEALRVDQQAAVAGVDGLALTVPGVTVTGAVVALELDAAPRVTFDLATDTFSPREVARAFESPLPDTADPAVLDHAAARFSGSADAAGLRIDALQATVDDSQVSGSAFVPASGPPQVRLQVDRLDLDRYLPPATPSTPTTPAATVEALLEQFGELDLDAEVTIGEARASGATFRNLGIVIEPDVTGEDLAQ